MRYGPKPKYPLRDMQVGQTREFKGLPKNFVNYVSKRGRELGYQFATRQIDGGRIVVRVS